MEVYFKCWKGLSRVPQVYIAEGNCLARLSYLAPYMFNKVMYGYWTLICIAFLANVWRAVRFLSRR
jgi:hypothetical protein